MKVKHIVFDFDGVLCKYEGWQGHDSIGEPIYDMIRLVRELWFRGHKLKLSTTRLNPFPFGWDKPPDKLVLNGFVYNRLKTWLSQPNINIWKCFEEVTGNKPFGEIYIDDRGLYFNGYTKEFIKLLNDRLK